MMRAFRTAAFTIAAACSMMTSSAFADFPDRTVHLIVPSAAGGTADVVARLLARRLETTWKQSVIVDNRPGAAGIIGTQALAAAKPDEHTLAILPSNHAINPVVFDKLPYDTKRDLAAIAPVASGPGLLVINPSAFPAKTVAEAFAMAKAAPGKYNYASPVPLTAGHRSMELLKRESGADIVHVPYKSGAQAVTDLLAGQVHFLVIAIPSVQSHVQSGALRALAVTSTERFSGMPDIPTLSESGFPGFTSVEWYGIFAPAGTPPDLQQKISESIQSVRDSREFRDHLLTIGLITSSGGQREMDKIFDDEHARWTVLSKDIKLQVGN